MACTNLSCDATKYGDNTITGDNNPETNPEPADEEIVQECCPRVNRELLTNKLWYFFFFGANGSLMPYLILFFKQLGLTPSQVGIVSGLKPFISFVFSPLWGYLADKTEKTKFIYIISLLAYAGGYFAYSLAPAKHMCDFNANITTSHHGGEVGGGPHIHKRDQFSIFKREVNENFGLDKNYRRKLIPSTFNKESSSPTFIDVRNKTVPINRRTSTKHGGHFYHALYPEESGVSFFQVPASLQILTLAEERPVNDTDITPEKYTNIEPRKYKNATQPGKETWKGAVHYQNSPWTVCAAAKANAIDTIELAVHTHQPANLSVIFSFLLIVTIVATFFSCPLITIVDTATIRKLKETNETHKYGKQRLWGSFAWGLTSFTIGAILALLPLCGSKRDEVNYYPAFYIFTVLLGVSLIIGLKLKFKTTSEDPAECNRAQKIIEGLKLLKDPLFCSFIFASFFIGMTMSIIRTFLFWHLKDLGAPQILFSLIAGVNCIAEVFVYYFSSLFIRRVGHLKVIYIALICYSLRLFYYGLLKQPWYVLAAEPLSGITTAAAWATMTSFVGLNANPESVTTMQGNVEFCLLGV